MHLFGGLPQQAPRRNPPSGGQGRRQQAAVLEDQTYLWWLEDPSLKCGGLCLREYVLHIQSKDKSENKNVFWTQNGSPFEKGRLFEGVSSEETRFPTKKPAQV